MRLFFLLTLVFFSGCVTSVCVDNLNITEEHFISFPDRPSLSLASFDRTVSYQAEPYVLKAFQQDGEYYVEFYPVRAQSRLYGPYEGNFSDVIRCE